MGFPLRLVDIEAFLVRTAFARIATWELWETIAMFFWNAQHYQHLV